MGYIEHDLVVVTAGSYQRDFAQVAAFRESLPVEWKSLIIGPIPSITNGFVTFVFAPDGSKSGWDTDEQGALYREQFIGLFGKHDDIVCLTYGADFGTDSPQPLAVDRSTRWSHLR